MQEKIAILGLGYVGLPVAVALSRKFENVVGFDISSERIDSIQSGIDWTGEISDSELAQSGLKATDDVALLDDRTFFIVTVPTPIDEENRPNLDPIEGSCRILAPHLRKGSVIVFESTVYPGVTDDFCGPLLEELSGLKRGIDFFLGYSPERINPGDKVHRLETIVKIISAEDDASLKRVKNVYGAIIDAGLHIAPSIKVAEAAKVIENTQRDLNIALMNELALIFDRMKINTADVLKAAGTKWNFLPFTPGLVGGHCIGVDPYYLTSAAERLGYQPEVILAGRRINDSLAAFVARKAIKLMIQREIDVANARVGILGLTFKPDVPDLRNSKVPDIVSELADFGVAALVNDPMVDAEAALHESGIDLVPITELSALDALIVAVNHQDYVETLGSLDKLLKKGGVLLEVMPLFDQETRAGAGISWQL
ncbi:MAG: nucleotide sugar dehydrogenase [Parasphingorhabdus sp.]